MNCTHPRAGPQRHAARRAGGERRHRAARARRAAAATRRATRPPATQSAQPPSRPRPQRPRRAPVTLNFVNADIEAVSRAMARDDRSAVARGPARASGQITVYSEQPMSLREAYLNYLAALRGLGFTVVETSGLLKVVPEADAKLQTGTVSVGDVSQRGDQIITQIFRLNHENVNSLVPVLRPLISPNNTINANPGNNTLVITDYAGNLQRIAKIIAAMDTPASSDLDVITSAACGGLGHRAAGAAAGRCCAHGRRSTGDAGRRRRRRRIRAGRLAQQLADRARRQPGSRAGDPRHRRKARPAERHRRAERQHLCRLPANADATRLATVLRAAYSSGQPASAGGRAAAPAVHRRRNRPHLVARRHAARRRGRHRLSPQAAAPVTPQAAPSTGGFIQADPATNSLIITAPEPVYRQLRAVIDQLDSRRAQIFIEIDDRRDGRADRRPTSASSGRGCSASMATARHRRPAPTSAPAAATSSAWPSAAAQGGTAAAGPPTQG